MKKKILLALLIIVGLGLVFWPKQKVEQSDKPVVKIVALYPMSGDAAIYGSTARKVADMFLSDFEAKNPKAKYKYEILFEDVQLSSAKAVTAMNKAVSVDHTDAVFATMSSVAMAVRPLADKYKVMSIAFATEPVSDGKYNFRVSTGLDNISAMTITKMKKQGIKNVSIVTLDSDMASVGMSNNFKAALNADQNMKFLTEYHIKAGDKNFDIIAQQIKKENPDMLFIEALPPESDLFVRALKKAEVNIPITGAWTIASMKEKALAEGMWFVDDAMSTPEFSKKFADVIGGTDTYYGEYVYTMLTTLINAWEKAEALSGKKPTSESVSQSMMKNTDGLKTPLGVLKISPDGAVSLPGVYKVIKDGKPILEK
jgi:branched-chain amino acid transport system substrate-binding protein